ncbi:YihY/virulence factor BrkB family protein [Haloferula chungangensis]|uniref:YihY/virulence factor BrkB family protein n=1 Tax=Haloferula chungangensis TaxID=1048331 RepID=A0ABW2L416_9BACT
MMRPVNLHLPNVVHFTFRVLRDFFFRNNGLLLAGAVAYNALLSLIPLSAVLVVGFSKFFDEELLMEALTTEVALIAPGAAPMIAEVLDGFLKSRELAGWIGVGVLLFFSSIAFRVLENAMSIIFHRPVLLRKRKFWVSALLPYLFIGLVAIGLILLTILTAVVDAVQDQSYHVGGVDFTLHQTAAIAMRVGGWLCLVLLFTTLYKVMPATRISFRLALCGGITAAAMWEVLRYVLTGYFTHLSFVNAVYGSMATTIIVLLTMEAASVIVLLGAQVIADLQQSIQTKTPWHEDPED